MPAAKRPARKPAAVPDELPEGSSVEVITSDERELLTNARELKKAVENQSPEPGEASVAVGAPQQPEMVLLEDERAQKEIDLRAINQQILQLRQSLAAAKLNRLLNTKGFLQDGNAMHDKKFRQEIHEMRNILDFLISLKRELGPTGIEEPALVGIEVPGA